jgi:hypothetical protein
MTSMARATHGPGENEYTLVLQDGEDSWLMPLLQREINRYERKQKLSDAEWMACDTFKQICYALYAAHREWMLLVAPVESERPN